MPIIKGKSHRFLASDSSTQKIYEFAEDGTVLWEFNVHESVFDLWALDNEQIMFSHYGGTTPTGVRTIDRKGNILFDYISEHENFSCQPTADGGCIVGELIQKRIVTVDNKGKIISETPVFYDRPNSHETMRSARIAKDGNFLCVQPGLNQIIKYSPKGEILKQVDIHSDAFGVIEENNGNILYTCMSGLYELDEDGKEIWSITDKDVPEIGIQWLLGLQLLSNGDIALCNWLGHSKEGMGVPAFAVDRNKNVVWSFDSRDLTVNMSNICVTDDGGIVR